MGSDHIRRRGIIIMKMERIERFNEAYANDDLKKCEFELLFLMLM